MRSFTALNSTAQFRILLAKSRAWTMYLAGGRENQKLFLQLFVYIAFLEFASSAVAHEVGSTCTPWVVCVCSHTYVVRERASVNECGQMARCTLCGTLPKVPAITEVPFTTSTSMVPKGALQKWLELSVSGPIVFLNMRTTASSPALCFPRPVVSRHPC